MAKKKPGGWYQKKKYPHFDSPLSFEEAQNLVTNPALVARHSFYPFLAYIKEDRKLKRVQNRNRSSKKPRPIRYASHKDGYIYAYYSMGTSINVADCAFLRYREHISGSFARLSGI